MTINLFSSSLVRGKIRVKDETKYVMKKKKVKMR